MNKRNIEHPATDGYHIQYRSQMKGDDSRSDSARDSRDRSRKADRKLERDTGLPSGSEVIVTIRPKPLTLAEKRRLAEALCGAWATDDSLPAIFAEIERLRDATLPRDAAFDVAS